MISHVPTASSRTGFRVVVWKSVVSDVPSPAWPFAPIIHTVGAVLMPGSMFEMPVRASARAVEPAAVAMKCAGRNLDILARRAVEISRSG